MSLGIGPSMHEVRTLTEALMDDERDIDAPVLCPDGSVKPLAQCSIVDVSAAIDELKLKLAE